MLPGAHRQVQKRAAGFAIYWYAWRSGPQIARFAGATLEAAEEAELAGAAEIAAGYARETKPTAPDGTVARVVQAFLQSPEWAGTAAATKASRRGHLETVSERWGALSAEEFAGDDTAAAIAAWRDELALASPSTAEQAMKAVSRLCSYGRSRSRPAEIRLPKDCKPTADMEKVYRRPVQLPPARQATLDAIRALPPLAAAACEIILHSGLRRSDAVRLCDTHVDEAAGIIRLGTKKGARAGRVAVIRLTPPLLLAIRRAQAIRDARYAAVCASRQRKRRQDPPRPLAVLVSFYAAPFTANGLYQHIRDAFEAAATPRINPHAFRRASATQKYLNGQSWAQIGRELGWGEGEAEKMGAIYVPDEAIAGGG